MAEKKKKSKDEKGLIRLHVFLAKCGVASRRASEVLIEDGFVSVNGKIVTSLGSKINPEEDSVRYRNKAVRSTERKRYFLFYKPRGVVSTVSDPHANKVVLDYFKKIPEKLYPVGRLDKESSGLMFLTNDGDLANKLMHPKYGVQKKYRVRVKGHPDDLALSRLRRGIRIETGKTAPCEIDIVSTEKEASTLLMTLREGKKREIREMLRAVGLPVKKLKRIEIGPFRLGGLKPGYFRELAPEEMKKYLRKINDSAR